MAIELIIVRKLELNITLNKLFSTFNMLFTTLNMMLTIRWPD